MQFSADIILGFIQQCYGNSNETIYIDHKYNAQSHCITIWKHVLSTVLAIQGPSSVFGFGGAWKTLYLK